MLFADMPACQIWMIVSRYAGRVSACTIAVDLELCSTGLSSNAVLPYVLETATRVGNHQDSGVPLYSDLQDDDVRNVKLL